MNTASLRPDRSPPSAAIALSLELPGPDHGWPAVIGMGPYLKAAPCVISGRYAYVAPVAGDLGDPTIIADYEASLAGLLTATGVTPKVAAHDLHPDFHSTRRAMTMAPSQLAVQHHHAHIAAVTAEHGHLGPVLGVALDGFGLGPDHQSWGGELLWVEGARYRRLGHLALLPQPGGDIAARQPWRMAAAALHCLGRGCEIAERFAEQRHAAALAGMLTARLNCPETSSCGRLFDAACGLLGVRPVAEYEGQAPQELEALVETPQVLDGGWGLAEGVLDLLPVLAVLPECSIVEGAELFHGTLIAGLSAWILAASRDSGVTTVALGGGCFFNQVVTQGLDEALTAAGLVVLRPQRLLPGDHAVGLGQAWIAAQWGKETESCV